MNVLIWIAAAVLSAWSIAVHLWVQSPVMQFFVSSAAVVPLAAIMGRATEAIAARSGERLGGLLSATFGNAVELIIGIFSLKDGLIPLVKSSITGSIISNLLFVLGLSFFVGGLRHPIQKFNVRVARSHGSMLMLGIGVAFVVPTAFAYSQPHISPVLSYGAAAVSLAVYLLGLYFSLFTHRELFQAIQHEEDDAQVSSRPVLVHVALLAASTVLVSLESDWLVGSVRSIAAQLGWSEVFIGVVVVAIIGNAAEHASAVWMAWKNRMDLSLEIAVGSTLQVAMFIAPVLFFIGALMGVTFTFAFTWPEVVSMMAAVLLVVVLVMDGESNWLEGAMAFGAYVVLAAGFYSLPG
ncbi:calcium/proton exchanger [Alicyclobacillus sendaiensis]|uniref:Ca(2+)/H(+) antiporter n=1 Tax=Alicyclobacillus sendaiensis PA2 TaxID=3029425 RepID=A0ABT6Y224_ALISE|nr:calcium/proton exchanger [Alicyclobacillus sendaiensis]MDI9260914.1 calcium/proton exchanger [Alicyclobacillus sendaiensis PA2]